jgi:hypothetical protein
MCVRVRVRARVCKIYAMLVDTTVGMCTVYNVIYKECRLTSIQGWDRI